MSTWYIEIGAWWLDRGYAIIPCQPHSKQIVAGFGAHPGKQRFIAVSEIERWWTQSPMCNMAVVCPPGHHLIDFDDVALYNTWSDDNPIDAQSYTELTALRGGRHVFGLVGVPNGLRFIRGIEVKTFCVVAPSQIRDERGTRSYERGRGEILELNAERTLRELTEPGTPTAYLMNIRRRDAEREASRAARSSTRLQEIKEHFTVVGVLQTYRGDVALFGRGRWITTHCPFHKAGREEHPSFAVDTERGFWMCHACGLRGDVINLYAQLQEITNAEAIRRMSEVMA